MNDDDLLNRAIVRAVRGETSPWDIDPAYPTKDALGKPFTFEERFKAGDKQILLWAVWDCAERGEAIPRWATDALYTVLTRAAKFEFNTWDDAFGKMPADGTHRNKIQRLVKYAIPVGERIVKLSCLDPMTMRRPKKGGRGIGDALFYDVAKEFCIGARAVKEYWGFFKKLCVQN